MSDTGRRYHWTAKQKQQMVDLYTADWSIEEIATSVGSTRETVRYHLRRMGVQLRPRGMQTARARAKYSGDRHGKWKGGRSRDHGYIRLLLPDHPRSDQEGYYPEHRYVVEQQLLVSDPHHPALEGQVLRKDWIVHHRNGKKDDNRPENLEAKPRSTHHSWLHYHDEIRRLRALLDEYGIPY